MKPNQTLKRNAKQMNKKIWKKVSYTSLLYIYIYIYNSYIYIYIWMYICIYKPKLFKIYVFYCFSIVVCSSKSKEIYIKKTNENFKKYKKITIKKQMFQIFFRYMLNSFKINIYIYILYIYIYLFFHFLNVVWWFDFFQVF